MTQPNTVHLHLHAHVPSPSASHPQSATTLTPDQMEDARFGVSLVDCIERTAIEMAKDDASPSGAYIVGVLMKGDGSFVLDKGSPCVSPLPLVFGGFRDDGSVVVHYPDRQLSPKQAAALAGVHKATIERAVEAGELPRPNQLSARRVGHSLVDVARWIRKRK